MRDSEVVAAIVASDPAGLAEAYDKYAAPLYTYCATMLREPADAADAVQDTFVIAAGTLNVSPTTIDVVPPTEPGVGSSLRPSAGVGGSHPSPSDAAA